MSQDDLGMLHVYTGDGKGKTTAALGLAMRAAGHGRKVIVIQFMKGQINYGELESAKRIPGMEIHQFGRASFVSKESPDPVDVQMALEGLEFSKKILLERKHDVVVLDELNVAIEWKLVSLAEVLEMLHDRPKDVEVIITGRYAPKEIIEMADLVTEMKEIKHPYQRGTLGREGVEF
ncbi:MAG: cob(I)yrinic acid a,c-diamide adenosyltransferase [Euryarchaeota archaeon]|nr:cob(I)yrinic acid a,c-diamide adenosyltransferase [Euryarchaeota archaeon]